ncbi:MAG TPA: futalosine hydrolase [Flavipsychrobacter sp.]|nr:futalosine hydrolase [Flavipsychrobacter sp.]
MDLLLVTATEAEIEPLKKKITMEWQSTGDDIFTNGHHRIHFLTTGVGMVATTYSLTKAFQRQKFDFAFQAGIGGSFDRNIALGEVVSVTKELFGDIGAEGHYNFHDVFELGFINANAFPFQNKALHTPHHSLHDLIDLPRVSSLTINTVSGSSFTATARFEKYGCQLESMEGAAFHFVCLQEGIPFAQVRAVSNYVEARDKSKWKIKEAVVNLNEWLFGFLQKV